MAYIIQTKKVVNVRGINSIDSDSTGQSNWINQDETYESIEAAQQQCIKLLEESNYKANNIRIVSVVCTFETDIKINKINTIN